MRIVTAEHGDGTSSAQIDRIASLLDKSPAIGNLRTGGCIARIGISNRVGMWSVDLIVADISPDEAASSNVALLNAKTQLWLSIGLWRQSRNDTITEASITVGGHTRLKDAGIRPPMQKKGTPEELAAYVKKWLWENWNVFYNARRGVAVKIVTPETVNQDTGPVEPSSDNAVKPEVRHVDEDKPAKPPTDAELRAYVIDLFKPPQTFKGAPRPNGFTASEMHTMCSSDYSMMSKEQFDRVLHKMLEEMSLTRTADGKFICSATPESTKPETEEAVSLVFRVTYLHRPPPKRAPAWRSSLHKSSNIKSTFGLVALSDLKNVFSADSLQKLLNKAVRAAILKDRGSKYDGRPVHIAYLDVDRQRQAGQSQDTMLVQWTHWAPWWSVDSTVANRASYSYPDSDSSLYKAVVEACKAGGASWPTVTRPDRSLVLYPNDFDRDVIARNLAKARLEFGL